MKLYSYCLRYDDGAAPNPYWGTCTLAICKPAIRRTAQVGDWVVGLGSANSPIGDVSDCVVYAMQVTQKLTMKEYDEYCKTSLPKKIPNWRSRDFRLRMGDCIYDFSTGIRPGLRWSVHTEHNRKRDLSGKFALLSKNYYYFGDKPVPLPETLHGIVHDTQGHKSNQNEPYVQTFVDWIENLGYSKNKINGKPQYEAQLSKDADLQSTCSVRDLEDDE
jgi:hypothetical protein